MLGFRENTELPQLVVEILHIREDARLDRTEVVIVELLTLGRTSAEERAACIDQILALCVQLLGNKEVFLLGSDRGNDALDILIAEEL